MPRLLNLACFAPEDQYRRLSEDDGKCLLADQGEGVLG
jgi:hypothetical protein